MKKQSIVIIGVLLISLFLSCTQADKTDVAAQIAEIERIYQDSLNALRQKLSDANDKIEILSYPADQRLASIDELFKSGDYVGVRKEAAELKRVFPNAKENDSSNEYLKKIEAIEAAKKAEEERIKSLGFKAIAEQATVKINYNTVTFSNFTIGKN